MNFPSNQRILEQVRSLVGEDGDVRAAVAFWGSKAVDQTGIAHKRNGCVRVLCDLFSGSCNPNEIETLLNCSNVKVRTVHGMHAKFWANGDHVIVGSANASMNGLGFETDGSNVEAAVELRNRAKAKQVRAWFEENWNSKATLEVDQQILTQVKNVWDKRQNNAPSRIMNYHIGAYMWVGPDDVDDVVKNAWREQHPDADENQQSYYYFASESSVPPLGAVILDFTCPAEGGEFEFNDTWKLDSQPRPVSDGDIRQVVDLRKVKNPRFPPGIQRRGVKTMIKCSVNDSCWNRDDDGWYVYMKFADFFYGTQARCHNREDRCDGCPFPLEREV